MKTREFSFIFMFLAHKTHLINVDRTKQSSVLNCILQLLLELFPIMLSVLISYAVHSPISVLISPLRWFLDRYLCHSAAILTLWAGDTGSRSLRNPSWCGLPLKSLLAPCWPRIVRINQQVFTCNRGQHLCKFLGLRELSFVLHHQRIFNLKIGKPLNLIFHISLSFEADPELSSKKEIRKWQ